MNLETGDGQPVFKPGQGLVLVTRQEAALQPLAGSSKKNTAWKRARKDTGVWPSQMGEGEKPEVLRKGLAAVSPELFDGATAFVMSCRDAWIEI